ncbi:MAG TPA: Hsp20/alpha crystallin family protein [Gaiella sp.]|jgi:HSP20 family protein|nr:Hsp20/alpha crystallin family protein [Gaiella sp.]
MTTLVRWEPFREIAQMQSEMGRLFDGLIEGRGRGSSTQSWVPALDVWETETDVVYAFDLPGLSEDEISIEVADDTLTVTGERRRATEEQSERFFRYERRYGSFSRAVGLPAGVDDAKIQAAYKDGVLEVRVPKPEEAKPRRIQLGSAPADVDASSN